MAGEHVLTASLSTVSYYRLVQENADELSALWQALSQDGFAYLDLRKHDSSPGSVLDGVNHVSRLGAEFFSTSLDEKMKYDVDAIGPYKIHGYVG
jgi:isopenicillin N synthase-like dioxygenase